MKTPRSDARFDELSHKHYGNWIPELEETQEFARQLEGELNEASKRPTQDAWNVMCEAVKERDKLRIENAELKRLMRLVCEDCNIFHHEKKHRHESGEECPIIKAWYEALGKDGL